MSHHQDRDAHMAMIDTHNEEARLMQQQQRTFAARERNATLSEMIAANDKSKARHALIGNIAIVAAIIAAVLFLLSTGAN